MTLKKDLSKNQSHPSCLCAVASDNYVFEPTKHGFEPIQNFPELSFNYPMIKGYYIKIVAYSDYGDLVYWYKAISTLIGLKPDDRIQIYSGSHDFRKPSEYGKQNNSSVIYTGLISNDEFAESLLKHLLGTTRNESLGNDSIIRYNENLGIKMRGEFPHHYHQGLNFLFED